MLVDDAQREVALFGGALRIVLPSQFRDMSDIVPVPDNQEVFQHMSGEALSFGQIIVEVMELAETEDANAALYHFDDLAQTNKS